jgi:multiple sugar transport system substrate-binding protein
MADDDRLSTKELTRRELLRWAGVGAAGLGAAGAGAPFAFAGPMKFKNRHLKGDLTILQWVHFVPAFDKWYDNVHIKNWGEHNDVQVKVDHINNGQIPAAAAAEVAAQSGHDIIEHLSPQAQFESVTIDHGDMVKEVQKKVGPPLELAVRSCYNPKTKRWHGFPESYVPDPVVYRHDLWKNTGHAPNTWEDVRAAAPKLKESGHPIGIGLSNELDSNMALMSFLFCFGAALQDENNKPTINSKQTVDALKFMAEIYKGGETDEIFGWNTASNNQMLYSGRGSLILNAISATRTPEDMGLPFSDDLWIAPIPAGPVHRLGLQHLFGTKTIWRFAKNKENAQKFIIDLEVGYKGAFLNSKFYNFPTFPAAVPNVYKYLAADKHKPLGKYTVLGTIAKKYTTNLGHPGYAHAAVAEVFNTFLVPSMFAQVAQGKMSAEDAAKSAQSQFNAIWDKWRKAGKL